MFKVLSNEQVLCIDSTLSEPWMGWKDNNDNVISVDFSNLQSINEVLRNTHLTPWDPFVDPLDTEFTSGFLDLLNVHNIYIHCPNIGHYNSVGVRGENSIIKKVPISGGFGYLILDSVVAPHDKLDVSRQSIKTMHFSLKNVHGNIIDLHGAHISLSLIFQTYEYIFNLKHRFAPKVAEIRPAVTFLWGMFIRRQG